MDGNKEVGFAQMVGNGIILFCSGRWCMSWGVLVMLRKSKWESSSGPVWPGIAAGRKGECRKYGVGRILRS